MRLCLLSKFLKRSVLDPTFYLITHNTNHVQKFAHADITHTLLTYLARYKDFSSPENMRRVVSLMHRQAVRAKAEGLFFKVFRTLLTCGVKC